MVPRATSPAGDRRCAPGLRAAALALLLTLGAAPGVRAGPAPAATAPAPPIVEDGCDFAPLPSYAARAALYLPGGRADASARLVAVEAALTWLAAHQAPDGGWYPEALGWCQGQATGAALEGAGKAGYAEGVTGAALLAFLGAGYGPQADHPFAESVRRGLEFLRAGQQADGGFGARDMAHFLYEHAYALQAVLEAYALTGWSSLGAMARRGLAFAVEAQNPGAGWRYGVRPGDSDTALTNTMAGALLTAQRIDEAVLEQGGLPPLEVAPDAVDGVHAWLDGVTEPSDGMLGYIQRGTGSARPTELVDRFPSERVAPLDAGALLVRRLLPRRGRTPDPAWEAKVAARLRQLLPAWTTDGGATDLLHHVYGTWAVALIGGETESAWQEALGRALLPAQRSEGEPCGLKGSWDAVDVWSVDGGRIYTTAFATMALVGHNRYRSLSRAELLAALGARTLPAHAEALLWRLARSARLPVEERALAQAAESPAREVRAAVAALLAAPKPSPALDQALLALLSDAEPGVRRRAATALGHEPAAAQRLAGALIGRLADQDPGVLALAASALAQAGPAAAPATERLRALLTHAEAGVRGAALRALWPLTQDHVELAVPLRPLLAEGRPEVRIPLLRMLEGTDLAPLVLAPTVLSCLASPDLGVVLAAAPVLRGDPGHAATAAGALSAVLAGDDLRLAERALHLLADWPATGGLPFEAVARWALHGPARLRSAALVVLGRAPQASPLLLAALHALASDPAFPAAGDAQAVLDRLPTAPPERARLLAEALTRAERGAASGALAGLRSLGAAAVEPLRALLRPGGSGSDEVRRGALGALGALGAAAAPALVEIRALLDFPAPTPLRVAALGALGAPGIPAAELLEPVSRLISAPQPQEARAAALALTRLAAEGPAPAARLDALLRTLWDKAPLPEPGAAAPPAGGPSPVAGAALAALPQTPAAARVVGATLVGLLGHPDPNVLALAVEALAALGADAVPLLKPVLDPKLEKPPLALRRPALRVLQRVGRAAQEALPWLVALLGGPLTDAAADALVPLGKPAVSALARLLASPDPLLRRTAARALGRIGPEAGSAAPQLRKLVKDQDSTVRLEAEEALKLLGKK